MKCFHCRKFCIGWYCDTCRPIVKASQKLALQTVNAAIKYGLLSPANEYECIDCRHDANVWEHRDYSKPLQVVPTCQSCNRQRGPALISEYIVVPTELEPFKLPEWISTQVQTIRSVIPKPIGTCVPCKLNIDATIQNIVNKFKIIEHMQQMVKAPIRYYNYDKRQYFYDWQ